MVSGARIFNLSAYHFCYKCGIIQGDSVARGPKLLYIKNYVIEIMLENLDTHTGKDAKQYLLIINAETGLLSHPNTLECISPNSGILFSKCLC